VPAHHYDARERLTVFDDQKNVGGTSQEYFEERFKSQVVHIADRLKFNGHFEPSSKLSDYKHEYLQRLFNHQLSRVEWMGALPRLTELMFTLTGQKTIVLVDEYDTPMSEALEHGYLEQVTTPPWFKNNSHIYPGQFLFPVHT